MTHQQQHRITNLIKKESVHTLSVALVIQLMHLAVCRLKHLHQRALYDFVRTKLNFLANPGGGGFTAGIAGSNPADGMDVRLLCLLCAV